jgi:hypothetical protein
MNKPNRRSGGKTKRLSKTKPEETEFDNKKSLFPSDFGVDIERPPQSLGAQNGKKRLNGKNDTMLHDRPENFDKKMGNLRKWLPMKIVNRAGK